jgi:hypothetical protein
MNPELSIIIVEYHSVEEIRQCAAAFREHVSLPIEIVVSSNSCYDQSQREAIVAEMPGVRWLFNARNGGFAYAMNEGLRQACGRYRVIMNSDCVLASPLDGMIRFMDAHPEVGAIAPQMRDGEGNVQDTARPYVSLPRFVWRQAQRVLLHKTTVLNPRMDYGKTQTVDWLIGAFIMVSGAAYEATGGLDERYFMYAEDLDWCTRIRQQGFEVVYYPKAVITYKGTRRARSNGKYARIFIRSHVAYWKEFGFLWGYPRRKRVVFEE